MKASLIFTFVVFSGLVEIGILKMNSSDTIKRRQKRYLVFEKGAVFTVQTNIAKSVIATTPRGVNQIAEYTLVYDLPTELNFFKFAHRAKSPTTTTTTSTTTTTTEKPWESFETPYHWNSLNDQIHRHLIQRKQNNNRWPSKSKCVRWNFYEYRGKLSQICLKRTKRDFELNTLSTSERLFYDIITKWSEIHGFNPRYCFMRTLCEARHFLLPYGHSLLHDMIYIFVSYTIPWALQHKTLGHPLRYMHSIDECAKLYGPHCRVSWLNFVTTTVHGSKAKFMR